MEMVPQQRRQPLEHLNRATANCDCVYSSTACSFQCTYVDTPIKPWKCNWLRYLIFYCLATKKNKTREMKVNASLSLDMTWGGQTHDMTHWAAEPADATHSSTRGAENTLSALIETQPWTFVCNNKTIMTDLQRWNHGCFYEGWRHCIFYSNCQVNSREWKALCLPDLV